MSGTDPLVVINKPLNDEQAAVFAFRDEYGLLSEGFVFRRAGKLYAYKNQCRHQPLTLDYGDGEFFTEDRKYLLCRNHGALFQPDTGLCVAGPCTGASLFPLQVAEVGSEIHISISNERELPDLE